jgi:hypothetical protein
MGRCREAGDKREEQIARPDLSVCRQLADNTFQFEFLRSSSVGCGERNRGGRQLLQSPNGRPPIPARRGDWRKSSELKYWRKSETA